MRCLDGILGTDNSCFFVCLVSWRGVRDQLPFERVGFFPSFLGRTSDISCMVYQGRRYTFHTRSCRRNPYVFLRLFPFLIHYVVISRREKPKKISSLLPSSPPVSSCLKIPTFLPRTSPEFRSRFSRALRGLSRGRHTLVFLSGGSCIAGRI